MKITIFKCTITFLRKKENNEKTTTQIQNISRVTGEGCSVSQVPEDINWCLFADDGALRGGNIRYIKQKTQKAINVVEEWTYNKSRIQGPGSNLGE